jgi:hypothetical protein
MKFFLLFLQKPNPYGPKSLEHEIFEILFDSAEIFDFYFRACSASVEIISSYAQGAIKSFPRMLSIAVYVKTELFSAG